MPTGAVRNACSINYFYDSTLCIYFSLSMAISHHARMHLARGQSTLRP
ncbi:unnamed protein product [Tenebrio molitor]|nr:unnamed protein product [Tenebrio molitor]